MFHNTINIAKGFLLALFLVIGVSYLHAAWTGPTASPPSNNTSPPINEGTTDQVKEAGLSVDALSVFGDSYISGKLGIGATSPVSPLEVNKNEGSSIFAAVFSNTHQNGRGVDIRGASGSASALRVKDHQNNTRFKIQGDGKVGIGTANPSDALEVGTAGGVTVRRTSGNNNHYFNGVTSGGTNVYSLTSTGGSNNSAIMSLFSGNAEKIRLNAHSGSDSFIDTGGNVGIGTTDPTVSLDVDGSVKGRNSLCIGSDCRTSWPAAGGGGDITSVTAGTGLSGGGTSGDVTLSAELSQDSCYWRYTDTCGHSCGAGTSFTAVCNPGDYVAGFGIRTWNANGRYDTRIYCCAP